MAWGRPELFIIALKDSGLKYGVLDVKEYPNGSRYFNTTDADWKKNTAKMVHNNYIVGLNNKINRFKENNLWFI